ncbi:MAG TPA: DUF5615 family PIN-like protein [Chloroflexota bacterium]|nr:DUF5615 family PIN-like protein [Chloroflexota bacterium]
MRLLLDAHLSGRAIGGALRADGHDVIALDEYQELEGLDDDAVLDLAHTEGRVLITNNVKDFPKLLRELMEASRDHSGCLIVVGVQLKQFGLILRAIRASLVQFPEQADWRNRCVQVGRGDVH